MKVTMWLLAIWFAAVVADGFITLFVRGGFVCVPQPCNNPLVLEVAAGAVQTTFMVLMVVFIIFGHRTKLWSYVGAMTIGILRALLNAYVFFLAGGPPVDVVLGIWSGIQTLLPGLVAIFGAVSTIELRRRRVPWSLSTQ